MARGPLVSTAWLAGHLADPTVSILDATWFMPGSPRDAAREYSAGHIPGAVFFPIDEICDHATDLPHMLSAPADFAKAVRRLGVNRASTVVVYDAEGLFSAPRVWWNFRAMGHAATFVLDGGLPRWTAEARPLESGWRRSSHGDFRASQPNLNLARDLEAVRRALADRSEQVVDARPAPRFAGDVPEPREGLRRGHMPGALNLPWSSVTADGALLAPDDLRSAFEASGVDLAAPIITSCGSGISAALLALALATLGRPDVAVYDGSWTEWGGRADTPVAAGAADT
jgi:thiosulfate/3-mercaptopyruvate sulfurtransferase